MRPAAGKETIEIGDDAVGFVFPVYLHSIPRIVREFASRLAFRGKPFIFAVATHNGGPGLANRDLGKVIAKAGAELAAGFELLMPGTSVILKDFTNPPEVRDERLEKAEASLGSIADTVRARGPMAVRQREAFAKRVEGRIATTAMKFYRLPGHFRSDESCVKCGVCARVCPRGNVSVGQSVSWGPDCESCLACFHWCPTKAIQIDSYTAGSLRYHHPRIKLEELTENR
jgi:ferredoxin